MEASVASKSGRTRGGEVGSVGTKCEFILCVTGGGERTKAGCDAATWRVRSGHGANAELMEPGITWVFADLDWDSGPSAGVPVSSWAWCQVFLTSLSQTPSLQPLGKCHFLSCSSEMSLFATQRFSDL